MKITKRQLRRIIKEEKARLSEGMKEMEMELVEEIVMMLIDNGAIHSTHRGYDTGNFGDDVYQDALDYIKAAVVPVLQDLASRGAWDRK